MVGPQHLPIHKHWGLPPHDPPPQAWFSFRVWEAEVGWEVGGEGAPFPSVLLAPALLQVFYPRENFSHPYCLRLLCEQVRAPAHGQTDCARTWARSPPVREA